MIERLKQVAGPRLTVGVSLGVGVTIVANIGIIVWGAAAMSTNLGNLSEKIDVLEHKIITISDTAIKLDVYDRLLAKHEGLPAHGEMRPRMVEVETEVRGLKADLKNIRLSIEQIRIRPAGGGK